MNIILVPYLKIINFCIFTFNKTNFSLNLWQLLICILFLLWLTLCQLSFHRWQKSVHDIASNVVTPAIYQGKELVQATLTLNFPPPGYKIGMVQVGIWAARMLPMQRETIYLHFEFLSYICICDQSFKCVWFCM